MPRKSTAPNPPVIPYTPEELAAETMAGDLLKAMIDELRNLPEVWAKLAASKQEDVIYRLRARLTDNVNTAVNIIAADNRPVAVAVVESVTFKDGVKAVLKMHRSESAHQVADAEGQAVLIVVTDPEKYMGGTEDVKADPDQRSIAA